MSALISAPTSSQRPSAAPAAQPGKFVMGLWGRPGNCGDFKPERWAETTVPRFIELGLPLAKKLDAAVYAMGQPAVDAIVAANTGVTINVLIEPPGNLWLAKMTIIRDALFRWPSVIWLDGDARQLAPLPPNFWEVLHERAPIQAKNFQRFRRKCKWRCEYHTDAAKANIRVCPSGAFIYCRDVKIIDRTIEIMQQNHQPGGNALNGFDDQQAMAYAIDEMTGGWKGVDYYHERFDPPWYQVGTEVFKCVKGEAIFTAN